jgi:hypothetical protein
VQRTVSWEKRIPNSSFTGTTLFQIRVPLRGNRPELKKVMYCSSRAQMCKYDVWKFSLWC